MKPQLLTMAQGPAWSDACPSPASFLTTPSRGRLTGLLHLRAVALILVFPEQLFRVDRFPIIQATDVTSPEKPSLTTYLKRFPPTLSLCVDVFNVCLTPRALALHESRDHV